LYVLRISSPLERTLNSIYAGSLRSTHLGRYSRPVRELPPCRFLCWVRSTAAHACAVVLMTVQVPDHRLLRVAGDDQVCGDQVSVGQILEPGALGATTEGGTHQAQGGQGGLCGLNTRECGVLRCGEGTRSREGRIDVEGEAHRSGAPRKGNVTPSSVFVHFIRAVSSTIVNLPPKFVLIRCVRRIVLFYPIDGELCGWSEGGVARRPDHTVTREDTITRLGSRRVVVQASRVRRARQPWMVSSGG
jgi:hypothetical protein